MNKKSLIILMVVGIIILVPLIWYLRVHGYLGEYIVGDSECIKKNAGTVKQNWCYTIYKNGEAMGIE